MSAYSARGIKVGCITGESSSDERSEVVNGNFWLVLFSPEALLSGHRWSKSNVVAFVVDETHCVKKW